jgi:signal transduction histidine kinase
MRLSDFKGASKLRIPPWLIVSLLAVACCVLATLQYRWITDFSNAQRDRLREDLQSRLNLLARAFNDEISSASSALIPSASTIDELGTLPAYAARYQTWKQSHPQLFRRIAVAIPENGAIRLWNLDLQASRFQPLEWPSEWNSEHARLLARLNHEMLEPFERQSPLVIELPVFAAERGGPRRPENWLLAELNPDYIKSTLFPELLTRYVSDGDKLNYDAEVVSVSDSPSVIYQSAGAITAGADASVGLLASVRGEDGFHPRPEPPGRGGPPGFRGLRPIGPPDDPGPRGPGPMPGGRWRLKVRHHAGSLEALVDQGRRRNIVLSGGLLLLILATIAILVRVARQSQQLAEAQMNFVAGVSHELRTPLTVIRTAAFNLRGKLAARPEQVEQYGKLIQRESERLTGLVEQVLRFASGEAGHIIREREPVAVETMIEAGIESSRESLESRAVELESHIEPGLPMILADRQALQHALRNIIENAVKYGTENDRWVGVYAESIAGHPFVEIRVADRGPGIPPEEREQIFDPFFRGRRAVADQLHGTGLGLSLVKKIVEAHGGTISVHSEPNLRTEFILRVPAATSELQHEFAHSLG